MNAIKFVKKFGLNKAKDIVNDFEDGKYKDCCLDTGLINGLEKSWWDICVYDLKRLVERHELINLYGGVAALEELFHVNDMGQAKITRVGELTWHDAKQAIADVEECNAKS